ncbi:hypothetical protein GCM10009665_56960 [Kitasatospora nipponensis]|uniref:Uncharacterized protein n=1 Tax=Kitasatospora nipponensis TaxID=258049 RepID=A0ABN1WS51_9ACTN
MCGRRLGEAVQQGFALGGGPGIGPTGGEIVRLIELRQRESGVARERVALCLLLECQGSDAGGGAWCAPSGFAVR